jgi:pseudouridylate synthase
MPHKKLPHAYQLSSEVLRAKTLGKPLVALESTVITHGLPYPENLELARDMENEVRGQGATPATLAVLDGQVCVGLNEIQLERLAQGEEEFVKISARDFGAAITQNKSGGTTVAGTMLAAFPVGIRVFATGGIGGVHRQIRGDSSASFDVSADLDLLGRVPMVVVCAGAKAILDLRATLEVLETRGTPVIGYQTSQFPAFYSSSSGLPVSSRADTPQEIANLARQHWEMGMQSAILVAQPPPSEEALPNEVVEAAVVTAMLEIRDKGIWGQAVTPYLLNRIRELTGGDSMRANIALLLRNARLAAQIARYIEPQYRPPIA